MRSQGEQVMSNYIVATTAVCLLHMGSGIVFAQEQAYGELST